MIRPAEPGDLSAVAALYHAVLQSERDTTRYTNWQEGVYPTEDTARIALEAETLYVGEEDGALWGAVILNGQQLPGYEAIPWAYPAQDDAVAVLHTLCIHPASRGEGRARALIAYCEELSRRRGKTVVRLDTWTGNLPANRLYPSLGYRFAGKADFLFQGVIPEQLNCYERPLEGNRHLEEL